MTTDELLAECRRLLPNLEWSECDDGCVQAPVGDGYLRASALSEYVSVGMFRGPGVMLWIGDDMCIGATVTDALGKLSLALFDRCESLRKRMAVLEEMYCAVSEVP